MEAAVVSAALKTLGPKIFAFVQGKYELGRDLERDIQYIRKELDMIAATIEDHERRSWAGDGRISDDVQRIWIQSVRELAYSIEDGIDRYLHDVALGREPGGGVSSSLRQKGRQLKKISIRAKFAAEIRELKRKSEEISKLRMLYTSGGQPSASGSSGSGVSAAASSLLASHTQTPAADLVGMDAPRYEILELMREDEGPAEAAQGDIRRRLRWPRQDCSCQTSVQQRRRRRAIQPTDLGSCIGQGRWGCSQGDTAPSSSW